MKKRFVPDILACLLVLVFAGNLGFYLHCRHKNVSLIEERDRHAPRAAGESSQNTERERLRRGEEEQELRDPNRAATPNSPDVGSEGNEGGVPSYSVSPGSADGSPSTGDDLDLESGDIDYSWLSSSLGSEGGRKALESLKNQEGELKLTAEQEKQLLRNEGTARNINDLMNAVFALLRPAQMRYLLDNKDKIDRLAASPISLDSVTQDAIQKLARVQLESMHSNEKFQGDIGVWSPKPVAIGIAMLTETSQEDCIVNREQARELIATLQALNEADNRRLSGDEEPPNLGKVLNQAQISYLYKEMRRYLDRE